MNIATALKSEISRVSRKEAKSHSLPLKKASAQYRSDIAALKRRVAELERLVSKLSKTHDKRPAAPVDSQSQAKVRFSAKGFASLRSKLGLSSSDMGLLIGVSDQSVYKYEKGEVQPRAATLLAIAGLRGLGKKAAAEKLAVAAQY
jgi:DNA-binding XRE family transcriptional regulator